MEYMQETEHRFVIETATPGVHFGDGLIIQRESYSAQSQIQPRHINIANRLGLISPEGGVLSMMCGAIVGFVRHSASIPGASEKRMLEAKEIGYIYEDELITEDSNDFVEMEEGPIASEIVSDEIK